MKTIRKARYKTAKYLIALDNLEVHAVYRLPSRGALVLGRDGRMHEWIRLYA